MTVVSLELGSPITIIGLLADALARRCQGVDMRELASRKRRVARRSALIAAACWLAIGSPAAAASIKGTVQFAGSAAEQPRLPVTVDQHVCGKDKDPASLVLSARKGIRDAVVWIDRPAGARPDTPAAPVQVDQQQCAFAPRVVLVPAGGMVEFLNSDRLLHNIHTLSRDNPRYNRTQPKGRTIPLTFSRPEIVEVTCDLHPWMHAWVVVMEHPFYAVTNADGEFLLRNVPPGSYKLHVWQEILGVTSRNITVGADDLSGVTVPMRGK
jgi:plastocyanin